MTKKQKPRKSEVELKDITNTVYKGQEHEQIDEAKGPMQYTGNEVQVDTTGIVAGLKGKWAKDYTEEDWRKVHSMGGIQKGINYARRRTMREWAKALGAEEITNKTGETLSRDAVVILQQYQKAMKGDTKSAEFLAKLLGELNAVELPKFDQTITLKID